MGYSCSGAALNTLKGLKAALGAELASSNSVMIAPTRGAIRRPVECFFERGNEREDGAIYGLVYYMDGSVRGRFEIYADGKIGSWPGLTEKIEAEALAAAKDPKVLSKYMGVI